MRTIQRVQGIIDWLSEKHDDDEGCSLGVDEVDALIKDLEIIKAEIESN